jgi:hypothetical protein
MTDLSSAAQEVLDAWDAKLNPMVTCLTHDPEREALAAALRAVSARMMDLIGDICDPEYLEGVEASSDLLDQIATELENHQ